MGRRKEEQEKQQAECYKKKITSEMSRKKEAKQNVEKITEK